MHAYLHTFIGDGQIYVIPQIFTCLFLWEKKVSWWKVWQTSNLLFSYSLWSLDPNIQSHFYVLSISICIFTAVFWSKQSKWVKLMGTIIDTILSKKGKWNVFSCIECQWKSRKVHHDHFYYCRRKENTIRVFLSLFSPVLFTYLK